MYVEKSDIVCTLKKVGVKKGDILLVHSSLKSFGVVNGGAETVISALKETLGEDGTLVMPTLCQKNWQTVYQDWHIDRPSDVGYITEVFRQMPDILRSNQATHSVAASGKLAYELTKEHTAFGPRYGAYGDYAFSHSSPWQKMYDLNAKVLFMGADPFGTNTFRHFCEYRLVEELLPKFENRPFGKEQKRKIRHFEDNLQVGTEWPYVMNSEEILKKADLLSYAKCGSSNFVLMEIQPMVNAIEKAIRQDPARHLFAQGWLAETQKLCGVTLFDNATF